MKPFEVLYLVLEPALSVLHRAVRKRLLTVTRACPNRPKLLDVGGRKSHYTSGVPADVTISDLPRSTAVQEQLNLGINQAVIAQIQARRSNVVEVLFDDMTHSALPDASFECVTAVEVLEHVEQDLAFVSEVHRVLKPGGTFLMTTPNGDYVPNRNPDHRRHYSREQLRSLLGKFFAGLEVSYAILDSRSYRWALKSWSMRRPMATALSMIGSCLSCRESGAAAVAGQARGTQHLFAVAVKSPTG